jgi:hypothetical protein
MSIRKYIYCQLMATAIMGLVSYSDRHAAPRWIPELAIQVLGVVAIFSLPALLVVLGFILFSPKVSERDKLFAFVVGSFATFAQYVAFKPMIQ